MNIFVSPIDVEAVNVLNENEDIFVDINYDAPEFQTPDELKPIEIIELSYGDATPILLETGEDIRSLNLDNRVTCIISNGELTSLEVIWRYEEFNSSVAGEFKLLGDVIIPDEYVFIGGNSEIEIPVTVSEIKISDDDLNTELEMESPLIDDSSSNDTLNIITDVEIPHENLVMLEAGNDIRELDLSNTAIAYYDSYYSIECEVQWQYDDFDCSSLGRQDLIGIVRLPEGYMFEGTPIDIHFPIYVYDSNMNLKVVEFNIMNVHSSLIPFGLDGDELETYMSEYLQYDGKAQFYTEFDDLLLLDYEIDFSDIDTNKVGRYNPFYVDLPEGMILDIEPEFYPYVYVIPSDRIFLGSITPIRYGQSHIDWLYKASNSILWYGINDGDWIRADAEEFYKTPFKLQETSIIIHFSDLVKGNKYYLCVQYDGDMFSNILEVDFTTGEYPEFNDFEGDRPGVDRGEQTLPDENVSSDAHTDYWNWRDELIFTDTGDALLEKINSKDEYVTYIKDGISISIPIEYLKNLIIRDTDIFSLKIKSTEDNTMQTSIEVNDEKIISELEPTLIVSHTNPSKKVSITDQDKNKTKVENRETISILNDKVYEYKIEDKEIVPQIENSSIESPKVEVSANHNSKIPVLIMCALGLIGAGAYFFISKRR